MSCVTGKQDGVTGNLPRRLAKQIRGECCYSGCHEPAMRDESGEVSSDFCEPHDAHERGRAATRQRRHRQKLADDGLCIDGCGRKVLKRRGPDGTVQRRRCSSCRKSHNEVARASRACVTGTESGVTGDTHAARVESRKVSVVDSSDGYARTRMKGGKRGAPSMEEQRRNDLVVHRRILASWEASWAIAYSAEVRELSRDGQAAARRDSDGHLLNALRHLMECAVRYGYEVPVLHPDEIGEDEDETDT